MKLLYFLFPVLVLTSGCSRTQPPSSYGPVPSERQLVWYKMEFNAFIHFNMNTFTDKEWGFGDESPALFNPTDLDCRQWARVCKEAGIKGIIITAKHHDGFCLWPSKYTEHSVKNSPWKNGQGDVINELSEACKEYGLKMGVYLSPWDRNNSDYGKPEYITYYRNQLRELLTNYGDIFEVWFDGANGGTGWYGGANENRKINNRVYYDWQDTWKIVRKLQPEACIFSDAGPDIRWVGDEQGWAGRTNWCTLNAGDFAPGVVSNLKFLQEGQEGGSDWVPAEADVSIRPGWFYHPSEDTLVKSLPQLLNIYYNSVGRNASLLLNLPVDRQGLINKVDVEQLMKLAGAIRADFKNNLALGCKITASNTRGNSKRFRAENVLDKNNDNYWATDDSVKTASLTINFTKPVEFNRFLVEEEIALGQRVQKFSVEVFTNNSWQTIASETTIGHKRILRFPEVTATMIRFNILASKACPVISEIGVYKATEVPDHS